MAKLAKIKTTANDNSVLQFIEKVTDEEKRNDCMTLLAMMKKATKEDAKMWGKAMIGFGSKIYKSEKTGREVEWLRIGFSPRKANLSLYPFDMKLHASAFEKLGKHSTGVGCLYIKKLADVDMKVLEAIIKSELKHTV